MNSPGQEFVDDFDSEELKPMHPYFLEGSEFCMLIPLFKDLQAWVI